MLDKKNVGQKVGEMVTEILNTFFSGIIVGGLTVFVLPAWAFVTFYVSDFLHISNWFLMLPIGILTSPIFFIPLLIVNAVFAAPRHTDKREIEAEKFYRSRMKQNAAK